MNRAADGLGVEGVHVWRGERHVLRAVSLDIRPHEVLHISGRNGSGKTTLLRVVCGLLQTGAGARHLAGPTDLRSAIRLSAGARLCFPRAGAQRRSDRARESALHGGAQAPYQRRRAQRLSAAHRCRALCGPSRAGAVGRAAAARRHGPGARHARRCSGCWTNRSPISTRAARKPLRPSLPST